jgi:beta-glucosidase
MAQDERVFPRLPPGFRFGATTAAFQIEGAADEDGKGPSIWDTFAAQPGRIADGRTAEVACDHYHRWPEDVALLKQLGAGGYRFSVSWPRVLPEGHGRVNERGLDFYDRLVDGLLEAGIAPMATLYHWDLPQALQDRGGWIHRDTIDHFAAYAELVGHRLGDRVEHWVPIDEPNVVSLLGHGLGKHAPGLPLYFDALWVAHHLLVAHGRATIALRSTGATSVGCANNHAPIWPASDSDADVGAAKLYDALWNGTYIEAMLLGRYPADLTPLMEGLIEPGDMATIRQPLDFYGVSYSSPVKIAAAAEDAAMPFEMLDPLGHPATDAGRAVVPSALREWLIMFRARYRAALPPIMVTEAGCSYDDVPDVHGCVDDQRRVDYLETHLRAVAESIERGVDVRGFYIGSLLDTFEWSEGFRQRYGLVHVDHETQVRTPKKSFRWLAELLAAQPQHAG